jgi:signal transduction histidine kinase
MNKEVTAVDFLSGGGEMGKLMRSMNWNSTPLGEVESWPQSLKTCVRIVLTSRQPMFVWWGKELINLYNDAYLSIIGGKHPDALGKPASYVWKEIWDQVGPRAETAMRKNEGTYDEAMLLIMERNGYPEETYYTFSYSPVPGDDGGTGGIICANSDDTQRILGERQLRTLKDLGKNISGCRTEQAVYEAAIDVFRQNPQDFPFALIYQVQQEGQLVRLAGKTSDDVPSGVSPVEFNLTAANNTAIIATAVQTNKIGIWENMQERFESLPSGPWQQSPGTLLEIPISLSGQKTPHAVLSVGLNPYRQPDEKYLDFFQLVADQVAAGISNVLAYEAERKRAEALAEIDRAKTDFFSNISHEFRTPLTLMLGPLEELLNSGKEEFSSQHVATIESIHRNAIRLLRLVNSLLDFSRIEAGRAKAHYSRVDIAAFTTDLAGNFRSVIENAGLKYKVTCKPVTLPVYVDKEMWEKVVLNLLSNAFKYTLKGEIGIDLTTENSKVILSVRDTGPGIPAKELSHMFERFHRVRNNTGRTHEGTGIGLSLVKELVNLHQGTITVDSTEGQGSMFIVTIPTGKDHLPAAQVTETIHLYESGLADLYIKEAVSVTLADPQNNNEQLNILKDEIPATGAHPVNGKSAKSYVLVVEDNVDMREYIHRLLSPYYKLEMAPNGKYALDKVKRESPDLIISDIMMPIMDGIELLNILKSDPVTQRIPVILLSARAGEEARIAGIETGADDYLVKPFSAKELLARVRVQIKIAHERNAAREDLEKLVTERTAELLKKNNELEQFAYVASHDLQEPLRKIQTFTEMLQDDLGDLNDTSRNYLSRITAASDRMTTLIKDLLNFSRLSDKEIKFEQVDLNEIADRVQDEFELLIKQKNAVISKNGLPVIDGIPLHLYQLFYNLVSNSLKFSQEGISPLITIHASRMADEEVIKYPELHTGVIYHCIQFTDNGIGFHQQYAEQIFSIFQRLNDQRAYRGTGIGLSLCRKIVLNHNGKIFAESAENQGASFYILLPEKRDS